MIIRNATYKVSSPTARQCPATNVPEYAFIGRSNVGKSSLINLLTKKGLAKTSQKPGKTMLINHFEINDGEFYIVDLPGYGYAARGKEKRDEFSSMIKDYILNRHQMTLLFVLIDIRHNPQKIDVEFLTWLGENGVPFAIVFTKADKLGPMAAQNKVEEYKKFLMKDWEELPPVFITSSADKRGKEDLLSYIETVNREITQEGRDSSEENC